MTPGSERRSRMVSMEDNPAVKCAVQASGTSTRTRIISAVSQNSSQVASTAARVPGMSTLVECSVVPRSS